MCRLVFVGVTGGSGEPREPFRAAGFTTRAAANPSCAAMPAKSVRLEVTTDMCSCDFYTVDGPDSDVDAEAARRRYERKGWSKSKIERAMQARRNSGDIHGVDDVRAKFVNAVAQLARSGARIHLLAHDFHGAFVDPFDIRGAAEVSLEDYLASRNHFPADTLVSLR